MHLFIEPSKWIFFSDFIYTMIIYLIIIYMYTFYEPLQKIRMIINNIIYNINNMYLHNTHHLSVLFVVFYAILFFNLLGFAGFPLLTSSPYITLCLSLIACLYAICIGIYKFGFITFILNLIPRGVSKPLYPLMIFIELLTIILKPFILALRLTLINTISHMILHIFESILLPVIPFKILGHSTSIGQSVLLLFLLIDIIKSVLQAYLFTLSIASYIKFCTESH